MKTLLLASIAILALTATADARHVYHYSLCVPAQKQTGERDPVTSIILERYAQSLDVKFRFASGKTLKRSEQYEIGSRNPDDNYSEPEIFTKPDVWYGKSIKWPHLVMGFKIEQGWGFASDFFEVLHDVTTGENKIITTAHCREVAPHEVGEVDDPECHYEGNACN
jgi:hypothetical protein